ncbi:MAG: polyphosphate kinase 2 family protein [Caldilineae bacterium]|nr:polyphosphate kinase 2 family protein [Chloroflexota bacterium]MCB9175704.1 polyphosphate kinase 2 family protein [Caldilineae bacterium]
MDRYRIKPGSQVDLSRHDPDDRSAFDGDKAAGKAETAALNGRLEALQELLYAEGRHKVLVVLQAMDAGGKDGTIRSVFEGVNPQGVKVASFKRPTPPEQAHDYLWRVHGQTPGSGEIVIFNRSHYEDVLVVRVHELVPESRWRKRFAHIRAFESMLGDEGTRIVKFFLHVSKDEQRERLQERIDDPRKRWKANPADLEERKRWDDYQAAYEEALAETSTEQAPWYVIPANANWYRNLVISRILVDLLEGLSMRYPEPAEGIPDMRVV